jgi:dihydroorotate dehydrogenase
LRADGIIARPSNESPNASRAMLYPLLRPLLFRLDPETAHKLTFGGLDLAARLRIAKLALPGVADDPVEVMGLRFPNRIGLAAGLDKNAEHIDGLAALGFGHIECGTVTPRAQPGNPPPRLFRIVEAQALVNRMGFNNAGLDAFLHNRARARWPGVVGLNIGKNFDTPNERAADDYLAGLRGCYAHAAYVTVNVSSPNTRGLRDLQHEAVLGALLAQLKDEQAKLADEHAKYTPLVLKIAPDLEDVAIDGIARLCVRHRIDAVIATNTTVARTGVEGLPHASEAGGLSGAPLRARATAVVRQLARTLDGALPVIGAGGVMCGADAKEKLDAGATLVQLYTGLVYRGPALVAECVRASRAHAQSGR